MSTHRPRPLYSPWAAAEEKDTRFAAAAGSTASPSDSGSHPEQQKTRRTSHPRHETYCAFLLGIYTPSLIICWGRWMLQFRKLTLLRGLIILFGWLWLLAGADLLSEKSNVGWLLAGG